MALTYLGSLTTDLDLVRFEIGDTVSGSGPLPGSVSNFTDAELNALIAREGSWGRAAAAACETLARRWAQIADTDSGPIHQALGDRTDMWAKRAQELRALYGGGPTLQAGVIALDITQKDE
jgi:hypothetical protein